MTDRPSITLPLCVLGAGIVHGLCIAALLPMLITVPAPINSETASSLIEVEVKPEAVASKAIARAIEQPPVLITGSLAGAEALRASAIAKMPKEDLREAEPVPAALARSVSSPVAELILADASAAAVEEIEAAVGLGEPIIATDAEPETPAAGARTEPAAAPVDAAQRKFSAPVRKGQQVRARAAVRAMAPTARRQTAIPVRPGTALRQAQARARTPAPTLGLGLLFAKPPPARRQAAGR